MSEYLERTLASKPTFGDYVTLEMKCYGVPNEHFIHEVLSSPFTSNSWREVPIKAGYFEEQLHDTSETVIAVRTQGINSRDAHIFAVRLADVLPMKGTNWSWRESPLRSRIVELEQDLSNKETEYTDLWDDALALQSRIAELEAKQRWIPVSERLPEVEVNVLAAVYDASNSSVSMQILKHHGEGKWFFWDTCYYVVTHWMPLPEPPEDNNNDPA